MQRSEFRTDIKLQFNVDNLLDEIYDDGTEDIHIDAGDVRAVRMTVAFQLQRLVE